MAVIPDLLRKSKTIAVVGLSSKKFRPSYGVAEYMQAQGYRIIPVNPNESEVLGREELFKHWRTFPNTSISSTFSAARSSSGPIVDSAIRVGANAIWMQEGVEHHDAAQKAREAGLAVVMDRCILKEHMRLE